jgi:hypothetical protein
VADDTDPTMPKTTAARPFKQVAEQGSVDSQSAGYTTMREMADQAQQVNDKKKANGLFKKAAGDGGAGFSLAGADANGNGFSLPLGSSELLGRKWSGFRRTWYRNDQRTMQFAGELNRGFDKIIKRAIKNNWTHIGMQVGIGPGKIEAPGPLVRALNRRIQELANGGPEADKAIRAMGYHPDKVRAQLQNLTSHPGHIKDVLESVQRQAVPPGGPPPVITPP